MYFDRAKAVPGAASQTSVPDEARAETACGGFEPIYPGSRLPGRIVAVHDGRGRNETPLWLPEQRALVFADALTAPGGRAARLGDAFA